MKANSKASPWLGKHGDPESVIQMTEKTTDLNTAQPNVSQHLSEAVKENQNRRAIGKLLRTTLVTVALTLVLCELLARFIVFIGKPALSENPQHDIKYLIARSLIREQDNVLLMGDSLMKQGLYPELLNAKLRKINPLIRVTNLAVSGGSQSDAITYLEYLRTKKHLKPKLVVFDYEVMSTGYKTGERDFDFHRGSSYLFNSVLKKPKSLTEQLNSLPSDFSYIVRYRGNLEHFVRDFLMAATRPKTFQEKSFYSLHDVSDLDSSADGMSPHHRVNPDIDMEEQKHRISSNNAHSPQSGHFVYNADAYSTITEYCQEHQIPLVLVWLPHEKTVYRNFWYQAPYTESWFKEKFEALAKQPGVYPLYVNTLPDSDYYYSDYHHLNTIGCVKASEEFAEELSQKYSALLNFQRHVDRGQAK